MKNPFYINERIDPFSFEESRSEHVLHIGRYKSASSIIINSKNGTGGKILDAGCGFGYGSVILNSKTGLKTLGVDIDKKTINTARNHYKSSKAVKFIVSDIEKLPLKSKSIDYIVCFEAIEHVGRKSALLIIREFHRVLKPDGLLIISCPNSTITKLLMMIFPKYRNPFHKYEFALPELKEELGKASFAVRAQYGQYPFFPLLYFVSAKTSIIDFVYKPSRFFPPKLCRYYLLVGKRLARKNINKTATK